LTAPLPLEENPTEVLIEREFAQKDLEQAITLIQASQGIARSRDLAAYHANLAVEYLVDLPPQNPGKP